MGRAISDQVRVDQDRQIWPRAVVFDMDGTLVDSKKVYLEVLLEVLERLGHPKTFGEAEAVIVPSIRGVLKKFLPESAMIDQAEEMVRELVSQRALEIGPCPGAKEALSRLSGRHKLGLLTNSDRVLVESCLGSLGLLGFFDQILTLSERDRIPSKKERYRHLLRLLGCRGRDVVFVGDTVSDVMTAKSFGSFALVILGPCSWERSQEKIIDAGADRVIHSLSELRI